MMLAAHRFRSSVLLLRSTGLLRWKHTVRVILTEDLPDSENTAGDVIRVKAGYGRNYLIPQKKALYATPENFERLGMKDPELETPEEKLLRLEREAAEEADEDLKAANILRKYLSDKTLKIWRNVDSLTNTVHPGMVDAKAVRQKLSKQLRIDLDDTEKVHLQATPLLAIGDMMAEDFEAAAEAMPSDEPCQTQIRELGLFLAKISLAGGYTVPLRVAVLKR